MATTQIPNYLHQTWIDRSRCCHWMTAHMILDWFSDWIYVEGYPWTLVFSTSQNGFSLSSLYRKMATIESPILLIIEDTQGNVIHFSFQRIVMVTRLMVDWLNAGFRCGDVMRASCERILLRHGRIVPVPDESCTDGPLVDGRKFVFYSRKQRKSSFWSWRVSPTCTAP